MACLKHNLSLDSNRDSYFGHGYGLSTYEMALGDTFKNDLPLSGNNNNAAGAYLGTDQQCATVKMMALDELDIAPDFIKWDIEGCEVKALKGAEKTILKHKPVMVMEVNYEALKRQGSKVGDLFAILESWEYNWKIIQENCGLTSPMYDIICNPKKSPEVVLPGNGESDLSRCIAPPPPVTPIKDMLQAVLFLKDFAAKSLNHRLRVMQNLSKNGLTPRYRPKKRKKK
jgi:FkbM family methyltransferase